MKMHDWGRRIRAVAAVAIAWLLGSTGLAQAQDEPPPLPFHTISGYGGGAITPMAYLVNPGSDEQIFGKPSMAMSYVNLGTKNLDALTVSETLFGRVELSYGADRLYFGSLPSLIHEETNMNMGCDSEWLHAFNIRYLMLKENEYELLGVKLPAVTAGVSFLYNPGVKCIDRRLNGTLTSIGYARENGEDFMLTATKTVPNIFGRPLIVTGGLRLSEASQLGFLGFGDTYRASFEGNISYLILPRVLVAYEFRQKQDPYSQVAGLINGENDWHALDVALILNSHSTFVAGWGNFGWLADEQVNSAWWFQFKYEF